MRHIPSRRPLFFKDSALWWSIPGYTTVAAYAAKGAPGLSASYINLVSPGTYDAALGVAPTLAENGWGFSNAQWLNTGIVPDSTWSVVVRVSGAIPDQDVILGSLKTPNGRFYIRREPTQSLAAYGSAFSTVGGAVFSGVLALCGNKFYINGVLVATVAGTWQELGGFPIYIGALNQNGTATSFLTGEIAKVAIYNSTLLDSAVSWVSSRM